MIILSSCYRAESQMLELRPNCECCDCDLPSDSVLARICSFECTFCTNCADERFAGLCPNCSGNLVERPIRPAGTLAANPASIRRIIKRHQACA